VKKNKSYARVTLHIQISDKEEKFQLFGFLVAYFFDIGNIFKFMILFEFLNEQLYSLFI